MKILYLGNKLSGHGYTPTSVETLGGQLEEFADVITASDKHNKFWRMVDMVVVVLRYRRSVDKVIIDTYSTSNFYFALIASQLCRICRIPYIPILHGGNLPARLDGSPDLSGMVFKHSLINVAPSGYLQYEFNQRGYKNVVVIPNNVDISNYVFTLRSGFAPRLLWVRAFDKTYNCTMAVDVLAQLRTIFPEALLCMVGPDKDGSIESVKLRAEELGVSDALTLTGRLSKQRWHDLSRQYDIFINTTNFDNTPVSVVEAMALGLAVVSTDVGGVPYLIEDGVDGFCTPKADAGAMLKQILWIVNNPLATTEMTRKARAKVEGFDWEVVKEKWEEMLR